MGKYRITLNGEVYELEIEAITEGGAQAKPASVLAAPEKSAASPAPAAATAKAAPTADTAGGNAVVSPMPGTIVRIMAAQGEKVSKGQPVLVLEAMKMENEITAVKNGVISAMNVAEGQTVAGGEALFTID